MESLTYQKNLKISPKKLRFLLPLIKKMTPINATVSLMYSPEKAARVFYKAIKSALANARHTLKVGDDLIKFKLLTVEEGQKLRRFKAGGRGTANPIMRRYAHIKIIMTADQPARTEKRVARKESTEKAEATVIEAKTEKEPKIAKAAKKTEPLAVKKTKVKTTK